MLHAPDSQDKTIIATYKPQLVTRLNGLIFGCARTCLNGLYTTANILELRDVTPSPMVETPTLMIWGEEDAALGIELTEGYEPYVRDFTLERLPGVSHWVQQEAPAVVNAHLLDWLSRKGLAFPATSSM